MTPPSNSRQGSPGKPVLRVLPAVLALLVVLLAGAAAAARAADPPAVMATSNAGACF